MEPPEDTSNPNRLLTAAEVCAILGYKRSEEASRLAAQGKIRRLRIPSGHYRYLYSDVIALKQSRGIMREGGNKNKYKDSDILNPKAVASLFRVRVQTVYRWGDRGIIKEFRDTKGKRCYRYGDIRDFVPPNIARTGELFPNAAKEYDDGSTIRALATKYGTSYTTMRRYLMKRTTLRKTSERI